MTCEEVALMHAVNRGAADTAERIVKEAEIFLAFLYRQKPALMPPLKASSNDR